MFAFDTERQERINDEAALDSCLDGFEDGYNGKLSERPECWAYTQGYLEGIARSIKATLERAAYFKEMAEKTKEIEEGRCEWLNELDKVLIFDEPTQAFEEF